MKNISYSLLILVVGATLAGCQEQDPAMATAIRELQETVAGQAKVIDQQAAIQKNLDIEVSKLRQDLSAQQFETLTLLASRPDKTAFPSLTDGTFSIATLQIGTPLLFSVEDVAPYANGAKVKLSIGNPTSASFQGLKLKVKWANAAPTSKSYDPTSLQTKDFSLTSAIKPGMWNFEEIVLAPAQVDKIGYLSITPEDQQVVLNLPPKSR